VGKCTLTCPAETRKRSGSYIAHLFVKRECKEVLEIAGLKWFEATAHLIWFMRVVIITTRSKQEGKQVVAGESGHIVAGQCPLYNLI
jgi:hypothetical protein